MLIIEDQLGKYLQSFNNLKCSIFSKLRHLAIAGMHFRILKNSNFKTDGKFLIFGINGDSVNLQLNLI